MTTDAEIDRLVYDLYDLSEVDVRIVEDAFGSKRLRVEYGADEP